MRHFTLLLFQASLALHLLQDATAQNHHGSTNATVMLSLDGFRWDYPEKTSTPGLNRIAAEGVKAVSLIPSFPSKTFPNHYTIATGLVPDRHGLVNNLFTDREMQASYAINDPDSRRNPAFYGGEPIWVTASEQGVRTASFYWVGSDVPIEGRHPDFWKMYDGSVPFSDRNDTIIKWLSLPDSVRPRLIMAYYHEPDAIGHAYGPDHPETFRVVRMVDSLTGSLYQRIRNLPEGENINFIVVSDHGMGEISPERSIDLTDYIPGHWPVQFMGSNPIFNLYAEGSWVDSACIALKRASHLKVWKPDEVPAHLDYGSNARTGDVIVVADSAWSVYLGKPDETYGGGTHGYDIRNTDMHGIFYASGPSFRKNHIHPSFRNINIYPLLAHLLGIVPAKTDGDLNRLSGLLK